MLGHHHNRSVVIKQLLIALLFCTCTALNAQSPNTPAPENVSPPQPAFRKFTFKHANAADVLKLLMQLEGLTKNDVGPGFAVDERTNSFIYQNIDDGQQARMFEEMCTLLDAETPNAGATNEGISLTVPAMGPEPLTFDFSFGIVRGDSVDSLRQQYNELEQRTHQLADRLKQSTSLGESQRNELELAVRKSFEARQTLQRAELADLARRMKSMQQSIEMRDKLADKVVERRVEDLLSPGLTWDPLKGSEQTQSGSSNSNSEFQFSSPQPSANPLSNGPVDEASLPQIATPTPGIAAKTTPQEIDLSTPQATLDYLHRDSIEHPNNFPSECYTDEALLELSGAMLQQLCFMSGLSQNGMQTKEVIDAKFRLRVDALIAEHSLLSPPEECTKAFELLTRRTPGAAINHEESLIKPDRQLLRLAAGILKSPKDFLPGAGELSKSFYETPADSNSPRNEAQAPPKYEIMISGNEAIATETLQSDASSAPVEIRLKRVNDRWLVSQVFSDAALEQMISSMSQLYSAMSPTVPDSAGSASSISPSASPPNSEMPEVLIARLNECGRNGSYKEFVALFTKEGIRDLAGSLMMSALQLNGLEEVASMPAPDGSTKLDSGVTAVREVLQRWLPQTADPEQSKAMNDGLSTMLNAIGGTPPNPSEVQGFVVSMRKSVEGIDDHGKFCIEMMQAYEKLTSKPFVYFDSAGQQPEWQVSQFGERAIATLGDGSPHSTTITLQHTNGTWRISSLYNELLNASNPAEESPGAAGVESSDSRTVTRRYSVGSFVTETYFTGKGSYDLKEVYEKYETEFEQSLQDLAKTVTAACTQPPRFVQVLSSSRSLLVGHTEAGHQEIADFMSDIGISNDRIRLRGECIIITSEDATTIGLELTQRVLSPEDIEKLRVFAKSDSAKSRKSEKEKSNDMFINLAVMDETILSGTRTPLKNSGLIPLSIAARIIPGTETIQLRLDTHGLEKNGVEYIAPLFQSVSESQAALLPLGDDFYWIATADIVHLPMAGANRTDQASQATPASAANEMQQRLQGEWDVTVAGFSGDVSDKRPYQAVVRGQLFLLQVMEDGKVLGTSPFKIIWPEPDHSDVVDIVWDPNNNSDDHFCPGRITCDGKSFRLAWRSDDSISGPAIRPTEICSGEGISYFECVRK